MIFTEGDRAEQFTVELLAEIPPKHRQVSPEVVSDIFQYCSGFAGIANYIPAAVIDPGAISSLFNSINRDDRHNLFDIL